MEAVCFANTHLERNCNPGKKVITPKKREEIARNNLNDQLKKISANIFKKSQKSG